MSVPAAAPSRGHTVDELTSAIAEIIDRPERAAEVARNARAHVERGFSKELRIARLETLYEEVLRGSR